MSNLFLLNISKENLFLGVLRKVKTCGCEKGILDARGMIQKRSYFRIGNGVNINPWEDPWIPWIEDKVIQPKEGLD